MKKLPIVFMLVASLVLSACGTNTTVVTDSNVDTGQTESLKKVTIAEFGDIFIYASLYVAKDNGYFEEEGLDVEIVPTGGDEKTFAALLGGSAQYGVADPTFVAISGERGRKGVVIASILNGVPFWGVSFDDEITSISRAENEDKLKIATFPAPSTAYTLQQKMIDNENINAEITEVAFGSLLPALQRGDVDIALELEPNVSTAVKNGAHVIYSLSDSTPEFAFTGLTVLPEYLAENRDEAEKVVSSLAKAMTFINDNPQETAKILNKRFPEVDKETAESAINNMLSKNIFPVSPYLNESAWDIAIEARVSIGDLKETAAYNDYVDMSLVK